MFQSSVGDGGLSNKRTVKSISKIISQEKKVALQLSHVSNRLDPQVDDEDNQIQ